MAKLAIFAGAVLCFTAEAGAAVLGLRLHSGAVARSLPPVPVNVHLYRYDLNPGHLEDFDKRIAVDGTKDPKVAPPTYSIDARYRELGANVLKPGSRREIGPAYVLVPEFITQAIRRQEYDR